MAKGATRITKEAVDALSPEPGRDTFLWDGELKGFGVRVKPSGSAAFIVQYRTPQGRTRRLAFAKVATLTPSEARKKAKDLLADVVKGEDPSAKRHEAREALTMEGLCDQYMQAARAGLVQTRFKRAKRKTTVSIDEGRVARHIVPILGNKLADAVTRADCQRMIDAISAGRTASTIKTKARGVARVTGGAGTAARVAGLLGGIFTWAVKQELVKGPNPARGLDRRADEAGDRVLSRDELRALGKAMAEAERGSPMAANALRLIALTGLRRSEAYGLRWSEIDFDGSCIRLRESKSGKSTRPIGEAAMAHLRSLPRVDGAHVFAGRGTEHARMSKTIASIFDAAGLSDARGHDLRRTFASMAAGLEYSDATIGELLGHARQGVTSRNYIRRPDDALIQAATRTARVIENALDGAEAAVVDLSEARR